MSSNNLRIIYQNEADMTGTTINTSTVATANTPAANMQKDLKSMVWRSATSSGTTAYATIVVSTSSSAMTISGVILAFSNLSSSATIRVRGYTGTVPTVNSNINSIPTLITTGATQQFDSTSGTVVNTTTNLVAPYQGLGEWNWGSNPNSTGAYSNTRVYGRSWLSAVTGISTPCTSWVIELYDPACNDNYIEISRLILGNIWSPKYNTSFGLSATIKDLSTNSRSEAGDLITFAQAYYTTLTLDLQYLTSADRSELFKIIRSIGVRKPLFISTFPDNSADWGKEQIYQCYGKLVQVPGLTHSMFETYASQLDIEEI